MQAPIRSVAAARKTGEWDGPGGWKEAAEDEIERVFVHFGSIKVVPATTRRDAIRKHGKGKVHTLHLVVPCKEKRNADGEVTRKKVRITAADLVSNGKIANTFAANLAGETSRLLTQLELGLPGARTVHKDVGGAYFHGKQPPIDSEGGRAIFAPIPPGWHDLGARHGLCFDAVQGGEPMILQIVGNVPGLQNAGAMWAEEFTGFLLDFGFTQSITDRRLFHLTDEGGRLLIVGTFVDDCKVVIQSESKAAEFTKAWEERYRDPPDVEATARDFLGLKYTRVGSTITISCNKATDDLAEKLDGIAPRAGAGAQCTSPLPDKALSLLELGAGPGNRLLPESALPRARSILGLAGWIVCHARPDAMLAFVAIARRVSPGRLTEYAWDRLVQWGTYLVKTRDVHLTMRKVPAGTGRRVTRTRPHSTDRSPAAAMGGRACSTRRGIRRCRTR